MTTLDRPHAPLHGALLSLLLFTALAAPSEGIVINHEEQYRLSTGSHPDLGPDRFVLATLQRAHDGSESVFVRAIERSDGRQAGTGIVLTPGDLGLDAPLVDLHASSITDGTSNTLRPGSLLVLEADGIVIFLALEYARDGSPLVGGPPASLGPVVPKGRRATVLSEVPNPDDASQPFLAVGTSSGEVILLKLAEGVNRVVTGIVVIPGGGPIQDLGAIPGSPAEYMLGVSVSGRPDILVVDPDTEPATESLEPATTFLLRDPRGVPAIDFAPPPLVPDSLPSDDPEGDLLVTANGTSEVTTFRLPAGSRGGVLEVFRVDTLPAPVRQVALGSLTLLPFDGTGVVYNRAFSPATGFAGRLWTVGGASMAVAPRALARSSEGRFFTAWIEVENGGAAAIDPATVELSVDGLPGTLEPVRAPRLLDHDGDGNLDLEVRFDRGELLAILDAGSGQSSILRAVWQYADGMAGGEASAELRVRRRDD